MQILERSDMAPKKLFSSTVLPLGQDLFPNSPVQHLFRGCFLWIDPKGNILGDRLVRLDIDGYETWSCEYTGNHVSLRRLHPNDGAPVKLPLSRAQTQSIEKICENPRIEHSSAHEAGHATVCYALRLSRINYTTLMFTLILKGNLYEQIRKGDAATLFVVKGNTSHDLPAVTVDKIDALERLKLASCSLGGIVGCQGDEAGADDDVMRFDQNIDSIPKLNDTDRRRLKTDLKSLVSEIMRDRTVSSRHAELARSLSQDKFLGTEAVEAVLVPGTLPDYSPKILQIAREFNLLEPGA